MPSLVEKFDSGPIGLGMFEEGGMLGKKSNEQTIKQDPWSGVQPYLLDYYGRLSDYMNSGADTVAGISPETQSYWDMTRQRALEGSPVTSAAQQSMTDTLSGKMFDQSFNKQFGYAADQLGKKYQDIVFPSISGRFSAAGRSGSGAEQGMYGRAMGELGTSLSGLAADIYGQERKNQMGAMALAPSISGMDYQDLSALGGVGAEKRAYAQEQLDAPLNRIGAYGSMLQPGLGFGQQTSPLYKNQLGSTLGGAATGYQLGGGYGAAIGGLLGYLGNR